jgi:hypothetical protein
MDVATVEGIVTIINAAGAAIALIIHAWKARDESAAHAVNAGKALDLALTKESNNASVASNLPSEQPTAPLR